MELAELAESKLREYGAAPAFPCNISRDSEAAHATPRPRDGSRIGNQLVKLDLGAHLDGYIADAAFSLDFSGNPDLVEAAQQALKAALDLLKPKITTSQIGEVIETTIREYGFRPIVNLGGHGLARYDQHAPPSIPNVKISRGVELKPGDVIAIEPFATDGVGRVHEAGDVQIYQLKSKKPVRAPEARKLLELLEQYHGLPFAKRWIQLERLDFALAQLERAGCLRSYPVLREISGGLISQAEHTVIILEDGYELIA